MAQYEPKYRYEAHCFEEDIDGGIHDSFSTYGSTKQVALRRAKNVSKFSEGHSINIFMLEDHKLDKRIEEF